MVKAWWSIFLTCGAIAGVLALGIPILAIIAAFCTFVIAPILVICSVTGIGFGGD
jgi:hypothetical protein